MVIEIINYSGKLNTDKISSLTNLLLSSKHGYHLIFSSRNFFDRILSSDEFSPFLKSVAVRDRANLTFNYELLKHINIFIQVDFESLLDPYSIEKGSQHIIMLSYRYFIESLSIAPTALLTENISDYRLFKIITQLYMKKNNFLLNYNFKNEHGGGSAIKSVFDESKSVNRLCLCLLDNDKKHPKGAKGTTIGAFPINYFLLVNTVKALDIDVHEIESLIPMDIIEEVLYENNESSILSFNILKKIMINDPTTKYYFDHKKGFTVNKIYELETHGTYWVPLLSPFVKNTCFSDEHCTCKVKCMAINCFGEGIYPQSINKMEKLSLKKIEKILNELEIKWDQIGKELFSWGCASKKQRVN